MDRRTYLTGVLTTGLVGTAGCLGTSNESGGSNTVLDPPDQDISASAHPTYGDTFPEITLPDPLADSTVSTAAFEADRAFLFTFVYSNCHDGACQLLLSRLANAQQAAAENELTDDTAFLAMTFDPERDTADVLREEGRAQGVDYDSGNWHFLRPEDFETASTILEDDFGLELQRSDLDAHDESDSHDEEATAESDDHHDNADGDDHAESDEEYDILHYNLILLVNDQGVVERAYPNATSVEWETISDDLVTVASN